MTNRDWNRQIKMLRKRVYGAELPSVSKIAEADRNPFKVLVSTIISLRTKDEVTTSASDRLFEIAADPLAMLNTSEEVISTAIYPAGFYRNKAKHIRECSRLIIEKHDGCVPSTRDELMAFPGVGIKTANLTLNLGFGIDAICVDTHVHRISNRLGWISTQTPEETEAALMPVLPRNYWIEINGLLVTYGKEVCRPLSPHCSTCPMLQECPKHGVGRTR
ncbi:MAG: endonuclease III [Spirochaetales bacterium]|jgi:endonuclease III|nr:endonuclease III [Spirochaetales bacterium]